MEKKLVEKLFLADLKVIEEPRCSDSLSGRRFINPKILSDADVVPDSHVVEPSDPFLSDELTVVQKAKGGFQQIS